MPESPPPIDAVRVELGREEKDRVAAVLDSGLLVQGAEVAAFEEEFSALVSGRHCVALNSGTSALHLGLLAAGVGPGDEVIVPSFTFAATANAVARAGATPVFVDIEPDHYTLDPAAVEAAITSSTRGVIPVHLYGQAADCTALKAICEARGIFLFEDACQAHGAARDGRPAGALGNFAAFSFYATKNMTTGEGGMFVCEDDRTARAVRLLRNQGMETRYRNEVAGLNNRMTDMAAAIGRVQLGRLPAWNERRRDIAKSYDRGLADLAGVITPRVATDARHVYHQYTIRARHRDSLVDELHRRGIGAAVYYPVPTHRLPAYESPVELPETDRAAAEVLSLPIRPSLTDDEVARVVDAVRQIAETAHE
jgi:dTDP-4-amino-4,6-dideoxygalactose transaminase